MPPQPPCDDLLLPRLLLRLLPLWRRGWGGRGRGVVVVVGGGGGGSGEEGELVWLWGGRAGV